MKYLFLFAHPDDESAACAGTIHQLTQSGEEVMVVSVTDGSAGEVKKKVLPTLQQYGSVGQLRRTELQKVATLLGISHVHILDFKDGHITNEMVWHELLDKFIEVIDQYQPDVVITFDHSGWYFHLDHVGVSIAATLAVQKAKHQVDALFLSLLQVEQDKWKYIFPKDLPATHRVDSTNQKKIKLTAFALHASQTLTGPRKKVLAEEPHYEFYQLARATAKGEEIFCQHPIFQSIP